MKTSLLASFTLLLGIFAFSACGGVEEDSVSETVAATTASSTFTLPYNSNSPSNVFTIPGPPPQVVYKICCFGSTCSALGAGEICPFSTYSCKTKKTNDDGTTTYSGCGCTAGCPRN